MTAAASYDIFMSTLFHKKKMIQEYLTIIRRMWGEYRPIISETKSIGLFDNIHRTRGE